MAKNFLEDIAKLAQNQDKFPALDSKSFGRLDLEYYLLTAVSGLGSSPALATCETSQVLLAGVSGVFSRGSPVFVPPTDWPVSYELKYQQLLKILALYRSRKNYYLSARVSIWSSP